MPPVQPAARFLSRRGAGGLALGVLLVLAGGGWFYHAQKLELARQAEAQLDAISSLKVHQLTDWRTHQLAEAEELVASPGFVDEAAQWLARPTAAAPPGVLRRFRSRQVHYGYADVVLLDPAGGERLGVNGRSPPVHEEWLAALAVARRERRPVLTDLSADPEMPEPHLAVVAPLFADETPASPLVGAVVLVSAARTYLYPLLRSWPTPSASAEVALVRRDGDDVLFLNDLRNARDSALRLRVPLSQTEVPAVVGSRGKRGMIRGRDYRGVDVVTVVQSVPGSTWLLVAKVDAAEALAVWRFRSVHIVISILALMAALLAVAGLIWQRTEAANLRARSRQEQELRQSEEHFRHLFDQAPDAVLVADSQGRYVDVNPAACQVTGYTRDELLGRTIRDLVAPDELPRLAAHRAAILAGRVVRSEWRFRRKDGSTVPVAAVVRRLPDGRVQAFAQDITERQLAGAELERVSERLALATRAAHLGIWDWDVVNDRLLWDDEMYALYGVKQEDFGGAYEAWLRGLHPEDRARSEAETRQALSGAGEYESDFRVVWPDGTVRHLRARGAVVRDEAGKPRRMIGVNFDVTDRILERQALQDSEDRFRKIVDYSPIGIGINRASDGRFVDVNVFFLAWLGYQKEEVVGKTSSELGLWSAPEERERMVKAMASGGKVPEIEARFRTKDGAERVGLMSSVFISLDGEGHVLSVVRDVTERQQLLEELRLLNAELEERVQSRTAALEAANRELEAFSYSVSHDLRAPLRAVDGYTRMLVEDHAPSLDAEGRRVCSVISQSAREMGQLIDDLLAFSRVGRSSLQRSAVDMAAMARAIFFELTTPEGRERIDFAVGPLPTLVGDPTLLRQVWSNLLSNAIKFSSKQDRALIAVSAEQRGGEQVYSVRDDGAGFDMQYVDKLFGVFQRLHSAREFEGTGVGLAIVQRIVHRHGGRVWAESEGGAGATFHMAFKAGG